jgi:putative ABC transport system permease protein
MILTSGAWLVGIGLVVGLAGALAMARVLAAQLYNLSPYDPFVFCVIPFVIVGVAILACWLPARRASRVDPLVALRHE